MMHHVLFKSRGAVWVPEFTLVWPEQFSRMRKVVLVQTEGEGLSNRMNHTSIAHVVVGIRNRGRNTANLIHPRQEVIQDLRKTTFRRPTKLHQLGDAGDTVAVVPDPVLTGN